MRVTRFTVLAGVAMSWSAAALAATAAPSSDNGAGFHHSISGASNHSESECPQPEGILEFKRWAGDEQR
jgi:hypothetical protein